MDDSTLVREMPALAPLEGPNRTLLEAVHPPDWANPEPDGRYNLVVIGAGTAGLVSAAGGAGLGGKVALVERHLMGGDCLVTGCVPSKALIRSARAIADVRQAGAYGIDVPDGARVDFARIMQRMRELRAEIAPHDGAERVKGLGADVFLGEARFTGPDTIEVAGKTLRFARAVIATGARAAVPPIPGLTGAGFLTNETVFSLVELPRRLAVIGGGPIGSELAQTFARFGSEVHLIEMGPQILGREDRDAAEIVEAALVRDGVSILTGASLREVRRSGGERILVLDRDGKQEELAVDEILVGVGRAPNVEGLGLEAAGVEFDSRTGVKVDDKLRTTSKRIYAAGDVCSPYKFTHTADAMARIVLQNALFFGRSRASSLVVPWVTYTDPEVAHVGMYEAEAKEKGIDVETIRIELGGVDRAMLDGEREGFLKVHHPKGSDKILGATLVSRHAGETISEVTLAMVSKQGLGTLAKAIHPYPTQADIVKRAADAYSRTRLTPRVMKIFETLLRWRR